MWIQIWNIAKVVVPVVLQLIGWFITYRGGQQHGLVESGEFTVAPGELPIWGHLAIGFAFVGAGTAAMFWIHHREKKTATAALPPTSIAGAIQDEMLHAETTEMFRVMTSPDSDDGERKYIFDVVNSRRQHLDKARNGGGLPAK